MRERIILLPWAGFKLLREYCYPIIRPHTVVVDDASVRNSPVRRSMPEPAKSDLATQCRTSFGDQAVEPIEAAEEDE